MSRRVCALAMVALVAAGCAAPTTTPSAYERQAAGTAEAVASALATALLGVDAAARHRTTNAYLSVLIGNAEKDALAAASTFDSRQPPDEGSDPLRAELDELLSDATDGLAALRITVRRDRADQLPPIADQLRPTLKELEDLQERYA